TYCNNPVAAPRYGYRAADKPIYFSLNNATEEQYLALTERLGMLDLVLTDPRFGNGGRDAVGMGRYSDLLNSVWNEYFQAYQAEDLVNLINEHGGMAVEFQDYHQVTNHPQVQAISIIDTDAGGVQFLRAPWVA